MLSRRDFQIPKVGDVLVSTHWRTKERTLHVVIFIDEKLIWYASGITDALLPVNFFHIANYGLYVSNGSMRRMR